MKASVCECCGQVIKQAHKEVLNKSKLIMLKAGAKRVIETGKNEFMVRDIADPSEFKLYNNFQKLRYHGLVTPARDEANHRVKGKWLITRNGWAFLRGEIQMPAYVIIKNNTVESRADRTVGFKDVWRGEECICTVFEYFDDDGKMVGVRPIVQETGNKDQARLFDIPVRY